MQIMVSVLCAAYNQEKYIEKTLQGFVMQKTDFAWEALINDDASTDGTRRIIERFAEKYPNIIKPVYHKENQFSQGISIIRDNLIPKAKGKYFAFCEGDDFWTDPNKLQKQVDYMEAHPECTLCIHNSSRVKKDGEPAGMTTVSDHDRDFSPDEVIMGGGGFCMTNSIMAPGKLMRNVPDYFNIRICDYTWQIYLASKGTTHCIARNMSAYRISSEGSLTVAISRMPPEEQIELNRRTEQMLQAFDQETDKQYHKAVMSRQGCYRIKNIFLSEDNADYDREKCRLAKKFFSRKDYANAKLIIFSPKLYQRLKKLYHKIKK